MDGPQRKFGQTRLCRALAAAALPAALAGGVLLFRRLIGVIMCPLYELTGIYCPGCGSGRASIALLRLDLATAFRYNPLYVLALPAAAYFGGGRWLNYVAGRTLIPQPRVSPKVWYAVCAVVLLFWVLRNIPVPPFTLLAPPG